LGARVDRPLAAEVTIKNGEVTLASARVALTPILDTAREFGILFKVPPHVSDVSVTITSEGNGTIVLHAVEVRAEDWPSELPLLLT
jgi:hypothetical protein